MPLYNPPASGGGGGGGTETDPVAEADLAAHKTDAAAHSSLLATTIGGATPGGTYTPTNGIEAYVGVCVTAGTGPQPRGVQTTTGFMGCRR